MTAFTIFDQKITVQHETWTDTGIADEHGNEVMGFSKPVERKVIAFYPLHRLPHHDIVGSEYVARVMIDFIMEVPDASVYHKGDRVTLMGDVYLVQGFPFNWADGNPFGFDKSVFGGSVHVERVT
jgi:hypothetical protein